MEGLIFKASGTKFLRPFCFKCNSLNVEVLYGTQFIVHKCRDCRHVSFLEYVIARSLARKYLREPKKKEMDV